MHSRDYAKLYDQARMGGQRKRCRVRTAWGIRQTTTCPTGRAAAQCCEHVKCQRCSSAASLKCKT